MIWATGRFWEIHTQAKRAKWEPEAVLYPDNDICPQRADYGHWWQRLPLENRSRWRQHRESHGDNASI